MRHQTLWRALFVLALLAVLLAAPALAEDPTIVASGACGGYKSNVYWQLDSAGTLTISGTGWMENYDSLGAPWYNHLTSIRTVIVQEGVTSLGDCAFSGCSSLTSITLPDSLTSIASGAFEGCSSLTSINLPDNITSIGYQAFYGCSSLTSISLPDGITSIGYSAFYGCSSLTSINLPDNIASIGYQAFDRCSSLTSINLPDGITDIGSGAFRYCSSLTSIILPEGITSIGYAAFDRCSSLTSIILPEGITSIDGDTFYGCSSLTSIILPEGITSIGEGAFSGCSRLTSINIPDGVTSIGSWAFMDCYSLEKVLFQGFQMPTLGHDSFFYTSTFTVYCYEFSEVDGWATDEGHPIVYLDNLDMSKPWKLNLPEDCRLAVGKSMKIALSMFPVPKNASVSWRSSAPKIVSVENGVATAHAAGTATITASCGGLSDTMEIEAYSKATDFALSAEEVWVAAKSAAQLSIVDIQPQGAEGDFSLSTSNSNVLGLSLSNNTILLEPKALGDATVTVREDNSGIVRECLVHVCYPVTAVEFDAAERTLVLGGEAQLTANVTARNDSYVNKLVSFSSSDTGVVTVDANGRVRARGTGTATITATAGSGVSASCTITVIEGESFTLPAETRRIKAEAFEGTKIERVVLPDGCEEIGARAFANNARLAVINMPDSIASIAEDAFQGCANVVFLCESRNAAAAFADAHGIPWHIG